MRAVRLLSPKSPLIGCELAEDAPGRNDVKVEIRACGICHSDAHYRSGFGDVPTPRTLGHEIAGIVSETGRDVHGIAVGDRVAIHYLRGCGSCRGCRDDGEQFCERGGMIGKHYDGGYADSIVVPAWNIVPVPPAVPLDVAAVMMCSTATAYHALQLAKISPGKSVAILGFGGLGVSAAHLSLALGAELVAAVDIVEGKLSAAAGMGVIPIDASAGDTTERLLAATAGAGFDIALDFTGIPSVSMPALRALRPGGCLVLVALSETPLPFNPYRDVLAKERRILGCSDHHHSELLELMTLAASGRLDLGSAITGRVPLEESAINKVLDALDHGTDALRVVITNDHE